MKQKCKHDDAVCSSQHLHYDHISKLFFVAVGRLRRTERAVRSRGFWKLRVGGKTPQKRSRRVAFNPSGAVRHSRLHSRHRPLSLEAAGGSPLIHNHKLNRTPPPLLPRLLLSLNCFPSRLAFASQLRMVKLNTPQHVHRRSRNFSSSPDCVEVSVCDLCWPCSDLFQSRCGKLKHKRAYNFFMLNIISYQTGKTVILHQQCLLFILNVPPPPAIAPDRFERDRIFFGGASDCVEHRTQCGEHVCASPLC